MAFKVVLVSNFDSPMVSDKLLNHETYPTKEEASRVADRHNLSSQGEFGNDMYASVKPADYKLYKFEP